MRTRTLAATGLLGVVGLLAGCSGSHAAAGAKQPLPTVPVGLVPKSLNRGAFLVIEDKSAHEQFAKAPEEALTTDGRLWGVRRGQQLVATLQVATLKPKVDLRKESQRAAIISQIAAGVTQTIQAGSVDVAANVTPNAAVYIWFGKNLFEVLQVKISKLSPVDPNALLNDIVAYQTRTPEWQGLPRSAT